MLQLWALCSLLPLLLLFQLVQKKKGSADAEFVMETILLGFCLLFSLFRLNVPFAYTLCPVYLHCSLKYLWTLLHLGGFHLPNLGSCPTQSIADVITAMNSHSLAPGSDDTLSLCESL